MYAGFGFGIVVEAAKLIEQWWPDAQFVQPEMGPVDFDRLSAIFNPPRVGAAPCVDPVLETERVRMIAEPTEEIAVYAVGLEAAAEC